MIQAVLEGKSLGYEYTEDVFTSTVFGTLKYLRPDMILIPFIESAFLYNEERTTLWEKLNAEGIELRCYREVEYVFWTWNEDYGEPDLILIFKDHVHGIDDLLLVVEAKFKSGKSGTEKNDQLVRYFEAVNNDLENFTDSSVSSFKGRKGYIVYLTEAEAYSDIIASTEIIQSRYQNIKENVFHLQWHQLYKTLEKMYPFYSSFEKAIADDLMKYMEKLGLRGFSGIPLPDKSLIPAFSSLHPVFYNDENNSEKTTYFDRLDNLDIVIEKIFFIGEISVGDIQKGCQITLAFQYIQQVFRECQRLIFKIDNQMAPEWEYIYGNTITTNLSASLQKPDKWIVEAIFRVYQNNSNELINKGITITFWGDEVEKPIITVGKIVYSDIDKRDYWDLYNIWFGWDEENEDNDYELNGRVNHFRSEECKYIEEAYVFSLPLISITDDEVLIEKIVNPLKEL